MIPYVTHNTCSTSKGLSYHGLSKDLASVINFTSKNRLPGARPIFTGEKMYLYVPFSVRTCHLMKTEKMRENSKYEDEENSRNENSA